MKLITRDTDYAIRAVCFIAGKEDELVSVADLVGELKIPRSFLRKILQVLNKKKILKSYKGRGGGFLLGRPAEKIFLVDLIKIFQGPPKLNECLFKKLPCLNRKTCALKKKIDRIEKRVISELQSVTLGALLK